MPERSKLNIHKPKLRVSLNLGCLLISHFFLMDAEEMDWNNSGKVNFREFLFGFINWVGVDTDDDLSPT